MCDAAPSIALELPTASFPSIDAVFRLQLKTTMGDLPTSIWLESKHSKSQCKVTNVNDHKSPRSAPHALPSTVVVAALERGLRALGHCDKDATTKPEVEISLNVDTKLQLHLVVHIFGGFSVSYDFPMLPLALTKSDVLESNLRDLTDEVTAVGHQVQGPPPSPPTGLSSSTLGCIALFCLGVVDLFDQNMLAKSPSECPNRLRYLSLV
ncbi:Aste57867_15967 [Aphanomyces stellatus]|uniref:Aste57867_15967 protein n=1 Tax=Aphanomyces stellatus TaxID=120398 RepID=A0A485L4N8_9STRA|nr:hypothetical protein As57867_015911 [Aphanomyces stellatus]VFT92752.1 Aste57867_15967 [Aphanomyces stellatus]